MSVWRKAVFVALACVGLGGCALMALSLEKPEVHLAGVALSEGNLLEQKLRLSLRVSNPNSRDIAVDGLSFAVEVNGAEFAKGLSGKPIVLPRMGETVVEVEARTSLFELLRQMPKVLDQNGKLSYRLRGEVVTHDYGRLPFDKTGEVSVEALGKRLQPKAESL